MAKKEDRMPTSLISTLLIFNVLLIVSIVLPFLMVISMGTLGTHIDFVSGLTIASGYPITGTPVQYGVYLIPIGGLTGLLSVALALVHTVKSKPPVVALIVLAGGLLALAGSITTCLILTPLIGTAQNPIFQTVTTKFSIGLMGALVSGIMETVIATRIILNEQS